MFHGLIKFQEEKKVENLKPIAYKDNIIIQEAGNELLVYDLRSNRAHCLTESAAFIWNCCDGRTSVEQMRQKIKERFGTEVSEDFVLLALEELGREGLLESSVETGLGKISRREALRKVGVGTMIALPLVASLAVPNTALAAVTCEVFVCSKPRDCAPPCNKCVGSICRVV
jgi:hypothetical protein